MLYLERIIQFYIILTLNYTIIKIFLNIEDFKRVVESEVDILIVLFSFGNATLNSFSFYFFLITKNPNYTYPKAKPIKETKKTHFTYAGANYESNIVILLAWIEPSKLIMWELFILFLNWKILSWIKAFNVSYENERRTL